MAKKRKGPKKIQKSKIKVLDLDRSTVIIKSYIEANSESRFLDTAMFQIFDEDGHHVRLCADDYDNKKAKKDLHEIQTLAFMLQEFITDVEVAMKILKKKK